MTALATPPKLQFLDANGAPLVGGKLYTYAAGTTTPQVTYTDFGGGTANANPVILDSRGEASVWLGTAVYKMALYSATNVLIWTVDNIGGFATLAQLAASGGSNLVGFLQAGTGAVATTVQTKLRESVSVKDFGAVGNGVADDTAAIQAASDHINSLGGGTLYFPEGDYKITAPITVYSNMRVIGAGGTATKITKTTNTPVAASATTLLVCLFNQSMGDASGDVNCIFWVYAAIRAEKVEIAHMTLRSNTTDPLTSPVRFGIATVGISDSHVHDLQIEYISLAAFVAPTFWFSKIELVQTVKCIQGIAIENGTTCSVNNNYVVGARDAGYFLRDLKYSSVDSNACDDTNNATAVPSYSNRAVYASSYYLKACYGVSFKNNGAEQCFGNIWSFDSCQNTDVSNNVCISPQSDYTGGSQIAIFYINTYARNNSIKNNINIFLVVNNPIHIVQCVIH
jgi:hypothetical protein